MRGQEKRDALSTHLAGKGIGTKVYFPPVHFTNFYRHKLGYNCELPVTENIEVKMSIYFDKYENYGPYHWSTFVEHSFLREKSASLKIAEYVYRFSGRDKKILDIGCGDAFLSFVASINNNQVTAIDNNNEAILLSGKFAKYNARLKVIACSVEEFRSDEMFDSIICIDVIEHLTSPSGVLKVVKANLKKDGTILVGTPLFISEDKVEKYHQKEFTASELDRLLGTVVHKIRHRIFRAGSKRYYLYYGKKNCEDIP